MNIPSTVEEFDKTVSKLERQCGFAIRSLAFLTDLSDNDLRWDKYRDSYSGHVLELARISIEQSLMLFCNRVWDHRRDVRSIHMAMRISESIMEELISRQETGQPDHDKVLRKNSQLNLAEIKKKVKVLGDSDTRKVLRVIRSENLAHSIDDSKDRQNLYSSRSEYEGHGVTGNDLFHFAEVSLEIINLLVRIRDGSDMLLRERLNTARNQTQEFWNCMPILRNVESFK
ncbi:hypothetical protein [Maritimibacter sp. UBA3975]|uniref:AbiU2 domain-containing protein n=1 Tax=Maritimibacter sp. UBA3975 TaxID=1946833 RepID=UPI0025BB1A3A|nr:hypothetical protein [Maritimibacter sp. UBA3975]